MTYTVAGALGVLAALALDTFGLRTRLIGRRVFWVSYAIIVVGQLAVNGVLTARGVVLYDPAAILGPRILYAPVEDLAFGFALVLTTCVAWVWSGRAEQEPE